MANSKIMNNAKIKKDDEYFTLYDDVANEIPLYKNQLKGKRIICPCDWDESFEETIVYSNGDEVLSNELFSDSEHIKNVNIQETSKRIEKDINLIKCNFIKFLVSHAEDYEIKSISVSGYDPTTDKGIRFQDINYKNYAIASPINGNKDFDKTIESLLKKYVKINENTKYIKLEISGCIDDVDVRTPSIRYILKSD